VIGPADAAGGANRRRQSREKAVAIWKASSFDAQQPCARGATQSASRALTSIGCRMTADTLPLSMSRLASASVAGDSERVTTALYELCGIGDGLHARAS
jgi:hypothetical protein